LGLSGRRVAGATGFRPLLSGRLAGGLVAAAQGEVELRRNVAAVLLIELSGEDPRFRLGEGLAQLLVGAGTSAAAVLTTTVSRGWMESASTRRSGTGPWHRSHCHSRDTVYLPGQRFAGPEQRGQHSLRRGADMKIELRG